MRAPDTGDRLLQLGASAELCDGRGWSPIDIVNCDDPEDHYIQLTCALPSWSNLPNHSAAGTFTRRRPAWSFATCDVAEFQEQLHDSADDFWLPHPKHRNPVSIGGRAHIPRRQLLTQDRFSTAPRKRTTFLSANSCWKTQTLTSPTPKGNQPCSSSSTSTNSIKTTSRARSTSRRSGSSSSVVRAWN